MAEEPENRGDRFKLMAFGTRRVGLVVLIAAILGLLMFGLCMMVV